jgi:hypothetical protein
MGVIRVRATHILEGSKCFRAPREPRSTILKSAARLWNYPTGSDLSDDEFGVSLMRSMLLLLIGIPIPIILLLALCTHHL